MGKDDEIKTILLSHIKDSKDWRQQSDQRTERLQESVTRYEQYEVGVKAVIVVGKTIIWVGGIIGACWVFFHDYFTTK